MLFHSCPRNNESSSRQASQLKSGMRCLPKGIFWLTISVYGVIIHTYLENNTRSEYYDASRNLFGR